MKKTMALALLGAVAGCTDDTVTMQDMAKPLPDFSMADLTPPPDLAKPPDLVPPPDLIGLDLSHPLFALPQNFSTDMGSFWVVAADFDGDAKLDLAVSNITANNITILTGNGDGSFKFKTTLMPG